MFFPFPLHLPSILAYQFRDAIANLSFCVSTNSLAQAEINLTLAVLYRPGGPELELYKTDESDIVHVHDFMIPLPKLDTKGVRVLIK